jgi:hypothetical protein
MDLTRGWKIGIIGAILGTTGWVLWGFSIFIWHSASSTSSFLFTTIWLIGLLIVTYGAQMHWKEKKNLQEHQH